MDRSETITIGPEDAGKRLDAFLAERLPVSRSRLQKLIKIGEITVDDATVAPHLALKEGVRVTLPAAARTETAPPTLEPRPDIPLDIVHEDDDVLVIAKPSGLLMHPSMQGEKDSVAAALVARFPEIAGVGDDPLRPGIVHRLDRDASGLVVVARNDAAFESLKRQFKDHTILKEYVVLTHGRPPEEEGTVELAIGRSAGGTRMAARKDELPGDRKAVTHYRVLESFDDAALLRIRTETGRTHQIRAHLKALGCPVAGDPLYARKRKGRPLPVQRLFLHADTLEFDHPRTGERLRFTLPLPTDLESVLTKLRAR